MNRSESVKELATALAKAQGEMVNPKFDTVNPFFKSKYASLASVRDAVVPVFSKNGLSIIQSLRSTESGVECETMLMHLSGEWVSDSLSLPITKHDAQGYGSAATYARRYSLMSFSGVVGDSDDDANAASEKKGKGRNEPSQQPIEPKPLTGAALKRALQEFADKGIDEQKLRAHFGKEPAEATKEEFNDAWAALVSEEV